MGRSTRITRYLNKNGYRMTFHNKLKFVASLTVCPSDIRKIRHHLQLSQTKIDPLETILVTPLFVSSESLEMTRDMADKGNTVYFDSGGYYVQIGRLKYEELYMPLLEAYRNNRWASIYTLPDHVPLSQDDPNTVAQKVQDTIDYSTHFFHEMPDELKSRAMPVVQGHNYRHIDACLDAYLKLGVDWIGFGSFGTMGANNEVNVTTQSAIELARYVIEVAHSYNKKVHLFGLGTPALVAMLKGIGADSFDSATWLKSAGFGQIFLPFMRSYNISHRNTVSELQRGITFEQFNQWCKLTTHSCKLCASLVEMQNIKMYRAVHNLIVMAETVNMVNQGKFDLIQAIYHNGSAKYRREFERWLQIS